MPSITPRHSPCNFLEGCSARRVGLHIRMVDNTECFIVSAAGRLLPYKAEYSERGLCMSSPTQEKLTLMRYIELLEEDDLVGS